MVLHDLLIEAFVAKDGIRTVIAQWLKEYPEDPYALIMTKMHTVSSNGHMEESTLLEIEEMVRNKKFRQDLYYRLERFTITLPPLRERKEDIGGLCDYFLNQLNPDFPSLQLDSQTLDYLKSLPWHENIRELRDEMEYIRMFYSDKKIIKIEDISERLREI